MLSHAFHRLAWSNLSAQAAEQVALAAVPIVAVMALGAGPGEIGFLAALQSLPFLLLPLPAGLLADRARRAGLMAGAEGIRALALLAIPLALVAGTVSLPLLAVVGFVAATGTVVYSVAAPSLVPALVAREGLAQANGRLELARSLAFAGGPALAGALVAWAGATPAFALAIALSMLAATMLARIPEPPRAPTPRRAVLHDLRDGALFAWRHELMRPILLTAVAWNMAWFVLQAAYVPYAMQGLGMTAEGVGLSLAMYGAGMVAGAMLAARIATVVRFGFSIALGPLVSVAAALSMALSIWFPTPVLPCVAFFLFGFGPILWTIGQTTLRQAITPAQMLGRVSALVMMATAGARPLGAGLGGVVGAWSGPEACLVLAAIGFVVQALVILASPVPRLARLPDMAAA